ncbi:HEPN family nuclease, partial [Klebsiella pneumoniae]|uniref:HEPN family nuclease n=1 Tax=Klebsiella pneumoniae TaxID=573 RepID=UPI002FF401A1
MGNYSDFETDFVQRTLALIDQYNEMIEELGKPFSEQYGTVAKLAMRQPFVLFKGLTFQKLCLPGAFRPGDHHN